jgi:hypothetical protein
MSSYICDILQSSPTNTLSFSLPPSFYTQVPLLLIITIIIHHFSSKLYTGTKRAIFCFLRLAYLTQLDDLQFHLFSCKWHNFILHHSWILFHGVYIWHIMFIHPLFFVHLGWFYSLASVNSATINMVCRYLSCITTLTLIPISPSSHQGLGSINLLSFFIHLLISNISYKWNQIQSFTPWWYFSQQWNT